MCIAAATDPEVETGNNDPRRLNLVSPRAAEIPWLCLDRPESFLTPYLQYEGAGAYIAVLSTSNILRALLATPNPPAKPRD